MNMKWWSLSSSSSFLVLCSLAVTATAMLEVPVSVLNGTFPQSFKFGVSTSSYQVKCRKE
jgi:hypothetical protein